MPVTMNTDKTALADSLAREKKSQEGDINLF